MILEKIKGLKLSCNRCKHIWVYKGKSDWYTSCPRCKSSVNVKKFKNINKK